MAASAGIERERGPAWDRRRPRLPSPGSAPWRPPREDGGPVVRVGGAGSRQQRRRGAGPAVSGARRAAGRRGRRPLRCASAARCPARWRGGCGAAAPPESGAPPSAGCSAAQTPAPPAAPPPAAARRWPPLAPPAATPVRGTCSPAPGTPLL